MPTLHNQISNKKLQAFLLAEDELRITVSFYKYFSIRNPQEFRDILYCNLTKLKVFGRIYIAAEGINAQISVPKINFDNMRNVIYKTHPALDQLLFNIALEDNGKSFWVLRMKVRSCIVADGIKDHTFNPAKVGVYLQAEEVNIMADDPKVIFIDMRNHYEYEIGHFKNAIAIHADTFRNQLPMAVKMLQHNKEKKIVMYCTGGIRCEKASAWMIHNGFKNVYHVEGGIINYVRCAREKKLPMKFIGKNFVFDERLSERVTSDVIAYCHQCNEVCDNHTNCHNQWCHLLFIQCVHCNIKYDGCCSVTCQKDLRLSSNEQRSRHKEQKHSIKENI